MKLTKIATLLLASMVALSPVYANSAQPKTVKTATKVQSKTTVKKSTKSTTINKKQTTKSVNNTHKLYGVKGAALSHTKVSTSQRIYREKGKTHKIIGKEASKHYSQVGIASYYGGMFHGRKTANGEIFNKNAYTAAHKTLALGSYALVTNLRNGKKVIVKINDRGPFSKSRIIDLSEGSARAIGMIHSGVAKVKVEAMQVDRDGYIIGKGAEALYQIAKREGLNLKVKGSGKTLAIKAVAAPAVQTKQPAALSLSKPKFALKVTQLADEKAARKAANSVKAKTHITKKNKGYEVIVDIATAEESQKIKRQLNRLGYTVFSYSEK